MPEAASTLAAAPPAPQKFVLPDELASQTELPLAQPPAEGDKTVVQNTAEQAPAPQPGSEKKPDTDQDPEKQRTSRRFERRLDKAYRRAAEATARAELSERLLNEERAKAQAPVDTDAPKLEQFDDIEKFALAREKYAADKALKADQTKRQTEAQKQAQARLVETWEEKADSASEKYDDWNAVVGNLKPTSPWATAIMHTENGVDVAYHLGKNLKEAERIQELPSILQVLEIGKLAAKLAAELPKPKTPSKAPAPITPLTGAAPVATDVPSEQDDYPTWFKKRQRQVHAKRY